MAANAARTDRLRILFLTPQFPYPPEQGTALRNYNLIAQVARRHDVSLLSFCGREPAPGNPLHALCERVVTVPMPTRSMADRLATLLLSRSPDMGYRLASEAFRDAYHAMIRTQRYDVVQVEGIELANHGRMIDRWCAPKDRPALVFDDHNAEYVLQQRAYATDRRQPRRWPWAAYSWMQWRRLARFERAVCRRADAVLAVSQADAKALVALDPEIEPLVLPNGVDAARYHPDLVDTVPLAHPAIVYTAKMDFRPNVDAVHWFVGRVWPAVRRAIPEARFYVVGKNPLPGIQALDGQDGIVVTGYVPDILPYFGGADVYVAPLRVGGGTRLKIMEALATGLPLVSTPLGAEGIAVQHEQHALLADAPAAFAEAVIRALRDPAAARAMGARGRELVLERYTWEGLVRDLLPLYRTLTHS